MAYKEYLWNKIKRIKSRYYQNQVKLMYDVKKV